MDQGMSTGGGRNGADADALLPQLRVVTFADSLAMPRFTPPDIIHWEETWPRQLSDALHRAQCPTEVINCGGRARTIDSLVSNDFHEHIELKEPDVVIIQIGVVDCAPRIFTRLERRIISRPRFPRFLRKRLVARRSARRAEIIGRDPLAKVYTSPERFAKYLKQFEERRLQVERPPAMVVLPIVGNPDVMDSKSPGYSDNVARYNELLSTYCRDSGARWITPEQLLQQYDNAEMFCSDGYHLSVVGNRRCAALLAEVIQAKHFSPQEHERA